MCTCERNHEGIRCGSEACTCHEISIKERHVYMNISFQSVTAKKADAILKAALSAAGQVSHSVYYDDPERDEEN